MSLVYWKKWLEGPRSHRVQMKLGPKHRRFLAHLGFAFKCRELPAIKGEF